MAQSFLDQKSVRWNADAAKPESPEVGRREAFLPGEFVEIVVVPPVGFHPPAHGRHTICAVPLRWTRAEQAFENELFAAPINPVDVTSQT